MGDNGSHNSLGEPEPIRASHGRSLLKRAGAAIVLAGSGVLIFATLMTPSRVRGATRSATLQWQERQTEIQQVIAASKAARDDTAPHNKADGDPIDESAR